MRVVTHLEIRHVKYNGSDKADSYNIPISNPDGFGVYEGININDGFWTGFILHWLTDRATHKAALKYAKQYCKIYNLKLIDRTQGDLHVET